MIIMNVETWNYLKIKILMDRREKLENLMSVDASNNTCLYKNEIKPKFKDPLRRCRGFHNDSSLIFVRLYRK